MSEKSEILFFVPYAIERITELRDEILERVDEMRGELRVIEPVCGEIHSAEPYWLSGIESLLSVDLGNPYDYCVDNSLQALQEFMDDNPPPEDVDSYDEIKKSIAEEDDFEDWNPNPKNE